MEDGSDAEGDGEGVGVEEADEIAARVQRRHIVRADGQRAASGVYQRKFVIVRRARGRAAFDIQVQRPRVLRDRHRQFARVHRHVHEVIGPLVGQHRAGHAVGVEQRRLGLHPQRQVIHPSGPSLRVVGHRQQPHPGVAFAHKVVQAARPVRRPAEKILPAPAVVIDQMEKGVGRASVAIVVVQYREAVLVAEVAQQVADGLVRKVIGHYHARDRLGLQTHREHQRRPRRIR